MLKRGSHPRIDLGRPKLGRYLQAHTRQPDLCGADRGNIRSAVAEVALATFLFSLSLDATC